MLSLSQAEITGFARQHGGGLEFQHLSFNCLIFYLRLSIKQVVSARLHERIMVNVAEKDGACSWGGGELWL